MVRKAISFFGVVTTCTLVGCQSGSTDSVAKLQEQLLRMGQQLNETKRQVDGLQEANQRTTKALFDLEASLERSNAGTPTPVSTRPVVAAAKPGNPLKSEPTPLVKRDERIAVPTTLAGKSAPLVAPKATSPTSPSRPEKPKEVFVSKEPVRTEPVPSKALTPTVPPSLGADDLKSAAPKQLASANTLCSRIWKQLGMGKDHEEAARSLGVAVSYVAACERRGGPGGGR